MSVDSAVDQRRSKHWGQYALMMLLLIIGLVLAYFSDPLVLKYIWKG